MSEPSDIKTTLARWSSRNGKWQAALLQNYAGAWRLMQYKREGYLRSCGCCSRPAGFFPDNAAALTWARDLVPQLFDVQMVEVSL